MSTGIFWFLHNKQIAELFKSFADAGRNPPMGANLIIGKDFFTEVSQWADSYDHNSGHFIMKKGHEKDYAEVVKKHSKGPQDVYIVEKTLSEFLDKEPSK
jgi:hypothetical protein